MEPVQRRFFVCRVQSILLAQLLVINLAVAWYFYAAVIEDWTRGRVPGATSALASASHPIVLLVAIALVLVILVLMYVFSDSVGKLWPVNACLLGIFTVATAYLVVIVCAESNAPLAVANTVLLVTVLVLVQVLYASLPCCTTYSFGVSVFLSILCTVALALWLILPATAERDAYLFQWHMTYTWMLPGENAERQAAVNAVTVWATLFVALCVMCIFNWKLFLLTKTQATCMNAITGAFELYVYLVILFIFSIESVSSAVASVTSYVPCLRPATRALQPIGATRV